VTASLISLGNLAWVDFGEPRLAWPGLSLVLWPGPKDVAWPLLTLWGGWPNLAWDA